MHARTILVWGAGGHAAVVADAASAAGATVVGFIADGEDVVGRAVPGFDAPIVARDADVRALLRAGAPLPHGADGVVLGVGDNAARHAIAALLPDALLPPLVHPAAVVARSAMLGAGAVVLAMAAVNPRAALGRGTIVNTAAVIEHDCVLGEAVHVSPGAVLAGAARVDAGGWVGAGAVVLPGVRVGAHAIVGAGAVVTREVAPGSVVMGSPARPRPR